ncbi:MAG: glutathione S-transferase [Hyphomicrobiales bacterium]|nr:MAG: glutathione S-transferase [Hyphomicrobiales bacterium]
MKLFYSVTSPYVRKVLVLAHEAGIVDRLEIVAATASPIERNEAIFAKNPLGKIPALVLDDGRVLFDSRVIVAYLDTLHDGTPFIPADGPAHFDALTMQALADGILDAALLCRYEITRPAEKVWEAWYDGQMEKIVSALDMLEASAVESLSGAVTISPIAVASALGYLDLRFKDNIAGADWRTGRPKLAAWYEGFSARPSMVATQPN